MYRLIAVGLIVVMCALGLSVSAQAQAINVSPDGPTIVHLDEDAGSVIVGNPAHASVVLENPRMMMVMAGAPGMTNLLVLNKNGQVILNRPVISGNGEKGLIRIQNACVNGGDNCIENKMYYCAEGERCHVVAAPQVANPSDNSDQGPPPQGGAEE